MAEVRSLGRAAIAADPPGRPAAAHSEAGPGPIAITIFGLYIVVLVAVMIQQGVEALPDRYAIAMLVGAVVLGRAKRFIHDWLPFIGLLVSYDFLRGFADDLSGRVQYLQSIRFDEAMFTVVPTVALQSLLFASSLNWWDYAATIVYFLHFVLPLGFAMVLWLQDRRRFTDFVTSLTLLSYAGWLTYIAFPSAPPWMAAQAGYLDGVTRILDRTINFLPNHLDLPTVYRALDPNPIAAIPSLHAAYPFLVLLFAVKFFRWRGLAVLPYVAVVWFAVVYLGEHYATDVLIGAVYATVAFVAGPLAVRAVARIRWRPAALVPVRNR
ncbi:MAG TPA: phosphatase PAP2 family protein [Candidatus Limnocylindria bacterium]